MKEIRNKFKRLLKRINSNKTKKNIYENHCLWLPWLPKNLTNEDIFLVSYPKSGNTYLRFLIAHAIQIHYNLNRSVNFFTLEEFVPSIRAKGDTVLNHTGLLGRIGFPRIIKSHSAYNSKYRRVLLIIRDPRDVLVSYYYHVKNYQKRAENWTFSEFIRHPEFHPKNWSDHTNSWLNSRVNPDVNIQILKYEDFITDPQTNLERLLNLLGLTSITKEEINLVVSLSSKENMKKLEADTASTLRVKTHQTPFVRKGSISQGNELSKEDKKYIEKETQEVARKLGYFFE